jgi:Protein of unknown function (DUF2639).
MKMVNTKGYYISELKKMGITKLEDKKLESYKTHVIANLYFANKK